MKAKRLFLGVDPAYERRKDIVLHTALARPDVKIIDSLTDLIGQVEIWSNATASCNRLVFHGGTSVGSKTDAHAVDSMKGTLE